MGVLSWLDVLVTRLGGCWLLLSAQFLWMESPVGYPVQSSCGSEAFEVLNVHDDASISVSARQRAPTCGLTYESVMVVSWAFMMFYGDIM
jgi:hypothetical protein